MATTASTTSTEFELSPVKFSRLTRRGIILGLSLPQVIALSVAVAVFVASPARAGEFTCPVDQGRFAHPHDGTRYIECLKGVPSEQTCAPGQVFDDLRKGCTSPGNVRKAPPRKPKAKPKAKKQR